MDIGRWEKRKKPREGEMRREGGREMKRMKRRRGYREKETAKQKGSCGFWRMERYGCTEKG